MTSNDIHLIFGTGPVGMAVMRELHRKKKNIMMVNRSGQAKVPDNVVVKAADASNPDIVRVLCKDATVVYNCTNVAYNRWVDLFPPIHSSVLEGAAAAGAKLVVMENLYMYGPTNGKPITEDLPYLARTRKGSIRRKMTEELFQAHHTGKVKATAGRASDFFGPMVRQSAIGEQVFLPALGGKAAKVLGNLDLLHTYTYIHDIGRALVILGENDDALGKAWHIPSPETVTTRKFIEILYQQLKLNPRLQVAPGFLIKILGLFNPVLREFNEMMYEFTEPFIMDHSSFENTFGKHATSLEKAIEETLEWYKKL